MNAGHVLTDESKRLLESAAVAAVATVARMTKEDQLPPEISRAFMKDYNTWHPQAAALNRVKRRTVGTPDEPRTFSFKDIPAPIVRLIQTELKTELRWTFDLGDHKVSLVMYSSSADAATMPSHAAILDAITWLCMLYAKGAGTGCNPPKELVVWVYLTSAKKTASAAEGAVLSAIHANTAFTRTCVPAANEIVIYRAEEWFKVFIHETMHAFGLDFSAHPDSVLTQCARLVRDRLGLAPSNTEVNVYEAYTEFWAEIINLLFIWAPVHTRVKINAMIALETAFSKCQIHKVLGTMGLAGTDFITQSPKMAKYRENTSILAYYILKSVVMCNMDDFFETVPQAPKGGFLGYVNFGMDRQKALEFCRFVTDPGHLRKCIAGGVGDDVCAAAADDPSAATMRMTAWEKK